MRSCNPGQHEQSGQDDQPKIKLTRYQHRKQVSCERQSIDLVVPMASLPAF
jgi:hypothetical protein